MWAPEGRYAAIGDTKSAIGPTEMRVTVFAAEMRLTWKATPESEYFCPEENSKGGNDAKMVPILEMIISHCECS